MTLKVDWMQRTQMAVNYLSQNADKAPSFWESHFPVLLEGRITTQEGSCDRATKGRITHVFQGAIDYLSQHSEHKFDARVLDYRQTAASLMYGLGLMLDLDPLNFSSFYIKVGEKKYEVSTEVVRRCKYFQAILNQDVKEKSRGEIDWTTHGFATLFPDIWELYCSDVLLEKNWAGRFYNNALPVAKLLQLAVYLGDDRIIQDCIARFTSFKTHKYPLPYEDKEILMKQTIEILDILLDHDVNNLMKTVMMNGLADTSINTLELLSMMEERGVNTDRIEYLAIQDHNDLREGYDFNARAKELAKFCPNVKHLSITLPNQGGNISQIPDTWKKSLERLYLDYNTIEHFPVETLDNMPNLEHIEYPRRYVKEGRWESHCFARHPIGCPKLH